MLSIKNTILFTLVIAISGCGGSGGGETTPVTPTTPTQPDIIAIDGYTGKTAKASVNQLNAHDVIFHSTTISDLASLLMFSDDTKYLRFDSLVHTYPTYESECESGSYSIERGSDTSATVTYDSCASGPYLINGQGSLQNITYDTNDNMRTGQLSFDALSIENSQSNQSFTLKGDVELDFTNADKATFEALVTESNKNVQYWLNNYNVQIQPKDEFGVEFDYMQSGRLFLSGYGYLDAETRSSGYYHRGTGQLVGIELMFVADNVLNLKKIGSDSLGAAITSSQNESVDFYTTIPYQYLMSNGYQVDNTTSQAVIVLPTDKIEKNTVVNLDGTSSQDQEHDLLSFEWQVISAPNSAEYMLEYSKSAVATFEAKTAGDYTFALTTFDGELYSTQVTAQLYAKQAAPEFTLNELPDEISLGQAISFDIANTNGEDDGPIAYSILQGPDGLTIEGNQLTWDGKLPSFGGDLNINIDVQASNNDSSTRVSKTITVTNENSQPALLLAEGSGRQLWADTNGDGQKELLVFGANIIRIYDLSVDTSTPTKQILTEATGGFSSFSYYTDTNLIVYADAQGNVFSYQMSTNKETMHFQDFDFSRFYQKFIVVNRDNDDSLEILMPGRLLDLATGEELIANDEVIFGDLAFADVDGDGNKEFIVSKNVYNAENFELLYSFDEMPSSIDYLTTDIDNDGKSEVIGFRSYGSVDYGDVWGDYQLFVGEVEEGSVIQSQSEVFETTAYSNFTLDEQTKKFVITTNGERTVSLLEFTENRTFEVTATYSIDDSTAYFRASENAQYGTGCSIPYAFNNNVAISCRRYYQDNADYVRFLSFIANVKLEEISSTLPTSINLSKYGVFGNIQKTGTNTLSVGSRYSHIEVDTSSNTSTKTTLPMFNDAGNFLTFVYHFVKNNLPFALASRTAGTAVDLYDREGKLSQTIGRIGAGPKTFMLGEQKVIVSFDALRERLYFNDHNLEELIVLPAIDSFIHSEVLEVNGVDKIVVVTLSEIIVFGLNSESGTTIERVVYKDGSHSPVFSNAFVEEGKLKVEVYSQGYNDNSLIRYSTDVLSSETEQSTIELSSEYELHIGMMASCKMSADANITYVFGRKIRLTGESMASRVFAVNNRTGNIVWHSNDFGYSSSQEALECLSDGRLALTNQNMFVLSH